MSERQLQNTLLSTASLTGWLSYHTYDSRRSQEGFPDLVLARPPVLLFRELKTDTGKVEPAQQQWLDTLAACTIIDAGVWRPSDLDQALELLRRWTR